MGKSSIDNGFSIAMLDSQRVHGSYGLQNMSPVTIVETNVCFSRDFSCWRSKHSQGLERAKAEKDPSETHQRQVGGAEIAALPRCRAVVFRFFLRLQSITLNERALHRNPGRTRKHRQSLLYKDCIKTVSNYMYLHRHLHHHTMGTF